MRRVGAFAIGLSIGVPAAAFGFMPPAHLDQHETIQVATGERARVQPRVSWEVPKTGARAEWLRFLEQRGSDWRAYWDVDRGVPARIFGEGIPVRDPGEARAVLAEHLALLAPGTSIDDFGLVSDHLDPTSGVRSLGFLQHHRGVRVLGGQISVRIKNGRLIVIGSEAYPGVSLEPPTRAPKNLREKAEQWIADDFGSRASARPEVEGPYILPIVRRDGTITYHGVYQVTVDARDPLGRWSVWLDQNASPVAREQTLMFASGTVLFNTPERRPGDVRLDQPAPFVQLSIGGQNVDADASGVFTFADGAPAGVTVVARGLEAVVSNQAGAGASQQFTIEDGQSFVWNAAGDELVDAQLTTFIASNRVKERAKVIAPDMQWLFEEPVQAFVNYNDSCNAFSDGTTINFFRANEQCDNTGRLPDVVYHEFGHSFHAHAIIPGVGDFDGALSEGAGDYLSATITNDPGMGRGFFYSDRSLRHIDQAMGEATWPEDIGEAHTTGIIFAGTMWDLRKLLIASMGMDAGVAYTDQLYYATLQRAVDIPSSYVEVLAADDDDGDLANGTPNMCAINDAFSRHGLADPTTVGPPLGLPERTGYTVHLPLGTRETVCPGDDITDATLEWRLRESPSTGGVSTLGAVTGGFAAEIPAQQPGQVIEYRIEVTTGNDVINFPRNRAAPWYEMFVGDVVELYCTDFESDPGPDGWAHELLAGEDREGADDWQWGVPDGTPGSGDPEQAFSGQRVYGNDLGGGNYNGLYQPGKRNVLHAPAVDVMGHTNVRLQFRRWLNVEDANFDQAAILSNGQPVWQNLDTGDGGSTHHEDREWVFQDVDLSSSIVDGRVQLDFQISSDGGLEFGGWNIDDFCVVAVEQTVARCGDGKVDAAEQCDDGNAASGDGCEADCTVTPKTPACGDGAVDPGEACDDGNATDGDGCESSCTVTPATMMPDPNMCPAGDQSCEQPEQMTPGLEEQQGGCGCTASASNATAIPIPLGLVLLAGLVLVRRRR